MSSPESIPAIPAYRDKLRIFKAVDFTFAVIVVVLWAITFERIFLSADRSGDFLHRLSYLFNMAYYAFQPVFVVVILWKAKASYANLMFSLFLLFVGIIPPIQVLSDVFHPTVFRLIELVRISFTTVLLMKTLQHFPRSITFSDVEKTFKTRVFQRVVKAMLSPRVWIIVPVLCIISLLVPFRYAYDMLFLAVLLAGIVFMYTNLKQSDHSEKNKILWILWGMIIYFVVYLISVVLPLEDSETQAVGDVLSIISVIALLGAFTMSIFFFDSFDTGVIVKRTIVNSFIFVLLILVYNTAEHYILHWISHLLHLSDILVSSIFSAILVMIISPLHHRLIHYFEHKLKK